MKKNKVGDMEKHLYGGAMQAVIEIVKREHYLYQGKEE